MAIRERNGKWQVYWNNPFTGRRESVTCQTEEEAQKKDALTKYQLQFERDLFRREESQQEKVTEHTLESAYYLYLSEKKCSMAQLESQVSQMKPWLKALGNHPVGELKKSDIEQVKSLMVASGAKGSTIRRKMAALRAVMRWCEKKELIASCPRFPDFPREENEKLVPPTEAEISMLLPMCPRHIQRVVILGSQFGMRIGGSELFRLKWSDVDTDRRVLRIPSANKNWREPWREVPIRAEMIPVFIEWRTEDSAEPQPPEYVVNYYGKPVQTIKTAWESALKRAGITRRIRPYDLRHAFATEAIAAGVDIGTVSKMMGHSSPEMVLNHYQHVMDKQKREAVESLPHVPSLMCLKGNGTFINQ